MIGFFITKKMEQKKTTPKVIKGTRTAFEQLISQPKWYVGLEINGKKINRLSAAQIKIRTKGNGKISQDYMEQILISAGYKIARQIDWTK